MNTISLYFICCGLALGFVNELILFPLQSLFGLDEKAFVWLLRGFGLIGFLLVLFGITLRIYSSYKYDTKEPKTTGRTVSRMGLLVALAPLIIPIFFGLLGSILGCRSDGESPGSCEVGGVEMANMVWTGQMLHWYTLMTLLPGLVMWAVGSFWHRATVKKIDAQTNRK